MNIITILLAAVVLALAAWAFHQSLFPPPSDQGHRPIAVNVGEVKHATTITRLTEEAVATKYLLMTAGAGGADYCQICQANEIPLGPMPDEVSAAEVGEARVIQLLGKEGYKQGVASEALTLTDRLFAAAGGKLQNLPAGAGTYYAVGWPLTTAAADGDVIKYHDHAPIPVVVT